MQLALKQNSMNLSEMRELLHLSGRTIRDRIILWRDAGFIEPRDEHVQRIRSIKLTSEYEELALKSGPVRIFTPLHKCLLCK